MVSGGGGDVIMLNYCVTSHVSKTFQFDLNSRSKILSNLTANWNTRGLTEPDNKKINHDGNCATQ